MKSTWTGRAGAVLVGLVVGLLGLGLARVREEWTAARGAGPSRPPGR